MMHHGQEGPPSRWWPSSRFHHRDDDPPPPPPPPNGSSALALILRLCATMLALASATVMAASSECTPRSNDTAVVTFTYTRFRAFVLLVGCSITAAILEAVAVYLQLGISVAAAAAPADDDKTVTELDLEDEAAGPSAAEITLVLVDLLVPALLYSSMAATYTAAEIYGDQIGACARFAGQVLQAKILALAACAAVTLAGAAKGVPLPFNVPPVLA